MVAIALKIAVFHILAGHTLAALTNTGNKPATSIERSNKDQLRGHKEYLVAAKEVTQQASNHFGAKHMLHFQNNFTDCNNATVQHMSYNMNSTNGTIIYFY